MAERKSVALHVRELVAPTADELGLKLWDVEYVKEGADYVLRITIDSDEGITIDRLRALPPRDRPRHR